MKKKTKLFTILTFLIVGLICIYYYSKTVKNEDYIISHITSKIFDFNEFEILVDSELSINDFKVINKNSGRTIFENGKYLKGIKNEYGHCIFELFWKEEQVYEFGHFKTNNWHTNRYVLKIGLDKKELKLDLDIEGPDKSKMDLYFKPVGNNFMKTDNPGESASKFIKSLTP